jgi:hypothetical protein
MKKRSHGQRGCQCTAFIGDGQAAEFLSLEQCSNRVNTYTHGMAADEQDERYYPYQQMHTCAEQFSRRCHLIGLDPLIDQDLPLFLCAIHLHRLL